MVQFGDFHFESNQPGFSIDRPTLLGWVTNTYWETNFRTHQSGGVHARYQVYPRAGVLFVLKPFVSNRFSIAKHSRAHFGY
jgi:hypothetical protein